MTDAQMKRLRKMRDQDIDYSDIADTSNLTGWTRLGALIPPANKVALTVRYDADVIAYFKKTGQKYQTRMNAVLRAYMLAHKKQSAKSPPASPAHSQTPARHQEIKRRYETSGRAIQSSIAQLAR